jgi:hypothetical protein
VHTHIHSRDTLEQLVNTDHAGSSRDDYAPSSSDHPTRAALMETTPFRTESHSVLNPLLYDDLVTKQAVDRLGGEGPRTPTQWLEAGSEQVRRNYLETFGLGEELTGPQRVPIQAPSSSDVHGENVQDGDMNMDTVTMWSAAPFGFEYVAYIYLGLRSSGLTEYLCRGSDWDFYLNNIADMMQEYPPAT